ncbi:12515_t:CDS:2, partial [Acaulospora colombiana]
HAPELEDGDESCLRRYGTPCKDNSRNLSTRHSSVVEVPTAMDDGSSSVVQRTPEEVWWMILDDVIDEPLLYATSYKGGDWFNDGHMSRQEFYDRYEKQRKVIGSVCRLWQTFARYKKFHRVGLKDDTDWDQETTGKARHVLLHSSSILSRFAPGTSVEWETRLTAPPPIYRDIRRISRDKLARS